MPEHMIPFIGLGRIEDSVILAYECPDREKEAAPLEIFNKLLRVSREKLKAGQRTRLQYGEGTVTCAVDNESELLYVAFTAHVTYSDKLVNQLLMDLMQVARDAELPTPLMEMPARGPNEQLRPLMQDLIRRYEDPNEFPAVALANIDASSESNTGSFVQNTAATSGNQNKYIYIGGAMVLFVLIVAAVLYFLFRGNGSLKEVIEVSEQATLGVDMDDMVGPIKFMASRAVRLL